LPKRGHKQTTLKYVFERRSVQQSFVMPTNFPSKFDVRSPESFQHDVMDLDVLSRSECTNPNIARKDYRETYVPVNYISPEAYALLAAAEASAARRADAVEAEVVLLNMTEQFSTLETESCGWRTPGYGRILSSKVPPKRFYRTFWESVSLKLLNRGKASQPSEAALMPMVF
jgi:hypothetical protein